MLNVRLRELAERDTVVAGCGGGRRTPGAGSGPGREGRAELEEQLEASLVERAGEARAEVAVGEVRAEARPAQGQPGATMQLSQSPDRVVRYEPASCSMRCGPGRSAGSGAIRRQVTEIHSHPAGVPPAWAQGLTAPSGSSLEDSASLSSLLHFVGCSPPRACHASATTQVQAPVVHHERRVVAGSLRNQ